MLVTITLTDQQIREALRANREWDTADRTSDYGRGIIPYATAIGVCGELAVGQWLGYKPNLSYSKGGSKIDTVYRRHIIEIKTRRADGDKKGKPIYWCVKGTNDSGTVEIPQQQAFRCDYFICCDYHKKGDARWIDIMGYCPQFKVPRNLRPARPGFNHLNYHIYPIFLEDPERFPFIEPGERQGDLLGRFDASA